MHAVSPVRLGRVPLPVSAAQVGESPLIVAWVLRARRQLRFARHSDKKFDC